MKRLYKSRKNKFFAGVCGGIAEYFNVDPVIIRLIFILLFFLKGSAILAYIIGMIVMPSAPEGSENESQPGPKSESKKEKEEAPSYSFDPKGALILGIVLIFLGLYFMMGNFHIFHRYYLWLNHNFWDFFIPGVLVLVGGAMIYRGMEKNKSDDNNG